MITLTSHAAEQVNKIRTESNIAEDNLRVTVISGGCSGNQYQLTFDAAGEGDSSFESNGVTIISDQRSVVALNGVEIDYVENLQGAGFVFNNPNAVKSCGCGNSFSC